MLRDLLKEGGLYTVANLLTKGVSLLLIPFYTAYFTPEDYGVLDMLVIFGALFNGIFSLQLSQSLGRFISSKETVEEKRELASTIILAVLFFYIVGSTIAIIFSEQIISWLSSDVKIPNDLFILSVLSIAVNGMFYMFSVYFRFIRKVKIYSILFLIHAISNILLTIFLVLMLDTGIYGVFYASLIVCPLILIVQIYLARNSLGWQFSSLLFKQSLKYSAPLVPTALLYMSLNFIDRLFIKEMIDFEHLGIYSVATKFALGVEVVVMGFGMAMAPIIFERLKNPETPRELAKMFHYYVMISALTLLILMLFAEDIVFIFTDPKYHEAAYVLPVLFLAPIFQGLNKFSIGINISKKTLWIPLVTIVSASINITLNYLLIPDYGIFGAAVSTCLSLLINNLILMGIGFKLYPIPFKTLKVLIIVLTFSVLIVSYFYFLPNLEIKWLKYLAKLALIGSFYLTLRNVKLERLDLGFRKKIK
jgi:O-antigen/teichoic acid export membrane protein